MAVQRWQITDAGYLSGLLSLLSHKQMSNTWAFSVSTPEAVSAMYTASRAAD